MLRERPVTASATDPLHHAENTVDLLDVSYLQHQRPHARGQQNSRSLVIREAHTSIVICGWDNFKWVGWAFVNAPLGPRMEENEEEEEEDCDDDEGQEDEPEDVEEDYFAVDGDGGTYSVQDANSPIWDPRCYWLRIIELRVLRILEEWASLVRFFEKGVEACVCAPQSKTLIMADAI